MKQSQLNLLVISLCFSISNFAQAAIENYIEPVPVSEACARQIMKAINTEDAAAEIHQIGQQATLSFGDDSDLSDTKNGTKQITVTVDEVDYMDGYTVWDVEFIPTATSCKVKSVVLSDVAL